MEFNLGAVQTASHPPPQSPTSASHNKWPRSQSPRSCQRSASIFLDCLQWVGCRRQTTKTQWPLVVVERPARWETAEAARQRPHQIDSSPSRPSGHWQPPTHSRRVRLLKAANHRAPREHGSRHSILSRATLAGWAASKEERSLRAGGRLTAAGQQQTRTKRDLLTAERRIRAGQRSTPYLHA